MATSVTSTSLADPQCLSHLILVESEGSARARECVLSEISENLTKLEVCGIFESSEIIKSAYDALLSEEKELKTELDAIKAVLRNK